MTRTEPDFLKNQEEIVKQPKRPLRHEARKIKFISKLTIYLLIIFVILLVVFGVNVINSGENLSQTLGNVGLWGQIKHLIGSEDKQLDGEDKDRINIALLGMGGIEHEGPFLTDTIMIASFKPSTQQLALVSVPRDLLVPIPGYGFGKINHANSIEEVNNPGQGGELTVKVLNQVFGLPIDYYIRIDFAGFKQIIDDLNGISVVVENTLDDELYPVAGKETAATSERYEHLYVEAGEQQMDGDLALKYVRSRQAVGLEGSDFARSKRQQQVIMAVKEKGLSIGTLINPYRISKIMDTLSQHLATNLEVWEIIRLFNMGRDLNEDDIIHRVFDDGPNGFLYSGLTENGAFVLQPTAGDFSDLQLIVQNIFNAEKIAEIRPQRIQIQNGTKVNGLASRTSEYLQSLSYQIIKIGNAPTQDYQRTVVYDLTDKEQNKIATNLADLLEAELPATIPSWINATSTSQVSRNADILIILGQDRVEGE
ncbi:MAG: hypothetical protein CMI53_05190 [Parcubacteria group bacterium]|nr:hypothetical protein [Parcubacteria group bacterium]|tara:strand:+ start:7312 stop:8754 length:1443 start_codon:yes stop_codon:yes gene_type:complete